MKYQQKLKGLFRFSKQVKKSLIFLIIVLLAAVLTASVATAFPKSISTANVAASSSSNLLQQGAELFQAEQFSEAAKVWQQAATAWQKSGDKLNQAQALSYLSLAEQKLGNWQAATQAIDSSLSLISSSRSQKSYTLILAKALNAQAHLQLTTGKTAEALKTWQEAAANYLQAGDLEGVIGSQINQAQAMQSLGLYRRAKTTLEQIEVELINKPNSLIKATGLRSLGNALRVTGELDKSRELLEESLRVAQEVNLQSAIASAHFSLGNTARAIVNRSKQGNESKAIIETESQLALAEYQKVIETSTSPMLPTIAQLSQFSLLVENRELQSALELRSQIKLNELPASRRSVYARINFAESLIRYNKIIQAVNAGETAETECVDNRITLGDSKIFPHLVPDFIEQIAWSDITEILTTSLQQSRSLKDRQAESYSLGKLAELYALIGKTLESSNLTKQALALSQAVNAADISYRWQWKLGQQLKTQDDAKGAIAAYNSALETLKSLRGDLVAVNPNNPDVQFSFRESVEPVYRELVELLISGEGEVSQENLRQARQVIESLQLAELDNFFQEACLDAKPVEIDQVDKTAAVIYPIILPDRLAVIVALPDKELPLRYYATLKSRCEIETLITDLKNTIGTVTGGYSTALRLSQQVYDLIIRPAETDLKNSKVQTLVFVLDGVLRNIPMAVLYDGKQHLIEKYSIAITPGLKLLPAQPLKQGKIQVLAAGLSEARQNFSALPNVKPELNEIKQQVNSPVLLIDEQFTTINLEQQIKSSPFPIVHIATHGQFGSQAENTFILAWDDKINVKQLDTLLGGKDKRGNRPIELLVLSACETAQGDNRAALGIAGVAVRAGARSTIATLWKVNDESTAILMVRFYQELLKGDVTKAEALRRAQLSLLQKDKYKLPYFWTPYVLVGNWR
ncbi:CHAT domain-containing protein [Aerosakkonemataceae cyanobacterium BLCC-F50]|uniref:CHAT domain-containing protein n=1 Tax=Floridaenema flaviceps BLCC-F50 TaxID=3153642 RepID=A0ABV4XKQ7_9CYAN